MKGSSLLHMDFHRGGAKPAPVWTIEQLNAVPVTSAQIERAWTDACADIPVDDLTLETAAIRARGSALASWVAGHDPQLQSNREALVSAAAYFSLSECGEDYGFEPAGFQEMILFIEELPW